MASRLSLLGKVDSYCISELCHSLKAEKTSFREASHTEELELLEKT